MSRKKRLLQIPQGAEGIYLEEALKHKMVIRRIEDLYVRWGYLPIETPVFDFFDTYRPYIPADQLDKIYRLMDREGDLLMLRSDVTLFLCKQMGLALNGSDLPLRVFYGDTILRHQNFEDISKNEFFQMGAELIGVPGTDGDLEVLCLAVELLESLGIQWKLHLGSSAILAPLFSSLQTDNVQELHQAVLVRDFSTMKTLLTEGGVPDATAEVMKDLCSFIGTPREFEQFTAGINQSFYAGDIYNELARLKNLLAALDRVTDTANIRVDLSELGSQTYHTGMVFQGYTPGIDSAFLSGGRYDRLLDDFGFDACAAGFSFLLRKIEGMLPHNERPCAISAKGNSFEERLGNAKVLRAQGKTVHL
ncbi:MAG: ATP phosphoribosyltransferase regulatory subunit [Spirochaetales bacterium]|nr:ATP phosphoribosyltransferase regulatory subunit [Spirochaetales bacterium]